MGLLRLAEVAPVAPELWSAGATAGSIDGMKISVSLPEEDVEFVDHYLRQHRSASRSSVIHQAITLLRESGLENAYANAWEEWETEGEADMWDVTAPDGVLDAAR